MYDNLFVFFVVGLLNAIYCSWLQTMTQNWLDITLENAAQSILELTSLQIGLDFSNLQELSRTIVTNQFGITGILEVQLMSEGSQQGYSIGFIAKQIYNDKSYYKHVINTSENFLNLLESRQSQWESIKRSINQNEIKKYNFPDSIFAPRLQTKDDETYIIQFEILPRFISRPKSGVSPESRYSLAGYALSRMHGFQEPQPLTRDYSEWFPFLHSLDIEKEEINNWKHVLESSKGGLEFGFGEYSLNSVQYNALVPGKGRLDSLTLIDPILNAGSDRTDDLGFLLSTIAEKYVENALRKADPQNISTRQILSQALDQLLVKSAPKILNSYTLLYPKLKELYSSNMIPVDFFAGVYLLNRSQSGENKKLCDILSVLGTQLIESHPISEMILK
ncbi:MAG: hypothetical protein HeimC3_01000 [Candidatus Heimdallarchaeota archaeon LC_3]|nr:MAG: hypothetical protein HeimC3_01000 [Candidatus Heimdallarchaeota archaeon LC_3]